LENIGIDELALPRLEQRLDKNRENILREVEAEEERQDQRRQAPQQAAAELDQMLEQRLLGVVDILHGSGRFSGGSSSSPGFPGVGDRTECGGGGSSAFAIGGISSGWPGSG